MDLSRFPLFAQAEGSRFELHPGETLFVPGGWWHTARILTTAITVSINGVSAVNCRDFRRDYCAEVASYSRLKATLKAPYLSALGVLLSFFERPMSEAAPKAMALTPVDFDPFADAAAPALLPLTEPQAEVWAAVQMGDEASCAYNQCYSLQLRGPLSAESMESALRQVINRHDALRVTIDADGERQKIAASSQMDLPVFDLSHLSLEARAAEIERLLEAETTRPFDLASGPLLRAALVREAPDLHRPDRHRPPHRVRWLVLGGSFRRLGSHLCGGPPWTASAVTSRCLLPRLRRARSRAG